MIGDQAATLRTMASGISSIDTGSGFGTNSLRSRSIAVTGGKGGVGKSNLSVNLSLELGALGNQVGLLDADFALANADLLCGVSPSFHLGHVITGLKELDEITIDLAASVRLIPGGSGVEDLASFSITDHAHVFEKVRKMDETLDFLLIDTAAGIAENVSGILTSASEVIVVVTPDPTSIVDAYATIKVILRRSPGKAISVVVNNIVGIGDAEQVYQSINAAVHGFLDHHLNFLGMIPHDSQVQEAIRKQVPVVRYAPSSPASRAIRLIARQLHGQDRNNPGFPRIRSFWDSLAQN
ncbi:MAG TPA: P-loop NTPase [Pyrinomonadaceae bacterium]|nr:P-loop NTPase [Pyrinomonadaceae bacterium]